MGVKYSYKRSYNIKTQINTEIILKLLSEQGPMRRTKIYSEVINIRKNLHKRKITYQVVYRDVNRLLNANLVKITGGGARSQIIDLK